MAEEDKKDATNGATIKEVEGATVKEEGPSELERKLIRQIEYYFGDHNLPRDKFLQQKVKEDNGWVTLETLITFNRLKVLSDDFKVIIGALKKSKRNILEISEDETKIRRAPTKPIPEDTLDYRNSVKSRSIYCKGFPVDSVLDKIQDFLDTYGDIEMLQLRRNKDRSFKGSVFCTYTTVAQCEKLINADQVEYDGTPLIRHFKEDYYRLKSEERKRTRDERRKEKEDEKIKNIEDEVKKDVEGSNYDKGCVLHLSEVPADGKLSRDDVKSYMSEHGSVRWVDLDRGDTDCYVRFDTANGATEVFNKISVEGVVSVGEVKLKARVLEGEEEKTHWQKVFRERAHAFANKKKLGKNRRNTPKIQRNKGGRGGGRGSDRGGSDRQNQKVVFDSSDDDTSDEKQSPAKEPASAKRPIEAVEAHGEPETKVAKTV